MRDRERGTGKREERVPRAVYWFGATSFFNDFASEIIYPLLPAFVTRTLGGGAVALGALDGAAESVAAGVKLAGGYLAQRTWLRGPLVVGGYAIAAVVRPLLALAAAAWQAIALRVADRVGKGLRTAPRDVMIADAVGDAMRARAFGLHRAADHAGAVAGPLVAAALLAYGLSVREVFWVAVAPGALAVGCALTAVRQKSGVGSRVSGENQTTPAADRPARSTSPTPDPRHLAPVLLTLVLASSLRVPETLLILRVQDLGLATAAVPLLWAALHVVRSAAAYPGGVLADRFGERPVLALGWSGYAALVVMLGAASSLGAGCALFAALGVATAVVEGPERALVARVSGRAGRGRGFGWYHALTSATALPGALLIGWLYQDHGAATAFAAAALTSVAAGAVQGAGNWREARGGG